MTGTRSRSDPEDAPRSLVGEETVTTPASPVTNLVVAAGVAALALLAAVLAARLPNPGDLSSHPGLLPMLTGISLLAMAIGLGLGAIRAGALRSPGRGAGVAETSTTADGETRRTLALVAAVVGYVVALDVLAFEVGMQVGGIELRIGSFECVSVPMLALILRLFWRASWQRCLAVSAAVVLSMAAIFRYGFVILLPGS